MDLSILASSDEWSSLLFVNTVDIDAFLDEIFRNLEVTELAGN